MSFIRNIQYDVSFILYLLLYWIFIPMIDHISRFLILCLLCFAISKLIIYHRSITIMECISGFFFNIMLIELAIERPRWVQKFEGYILNYWYYILTSRRDRNPLLNSLDLLHRNLDHMLRNQGFRIENSNSFTSNILNMTHFLKSINEQKLFRIRFWKICTFHFITILSI